MGCICKRGRIYWVKYYRARSPTLSLFLMCPTAIR